MARPSSSRSRSRGTRLRSPLRRHHASRSLLAVAAFIVFMYLAWMLRWRVFVDSRDKLQIGQTTEISGTIDYTALRPEPEDAGEIQLFVRELGDDGWRDTELALPLQDGASWQWFGALPGQHYEFQAVLTIDGEEIKRTEIVQTTAPAYGVDLPLAVTWHDLPEDVVAGSTTALGGQVSLNGYLPASRLLDVYALHSKHFETEIYPITPEVLSSATRIAHVSQPGRVADWKWDKAAPLEKYMIVAVLSSQGKIIGVTEQYILADAGEQELQQVINSFAQSPSSPQAALSSLFASTLTSSPSLPLNEISGVITIEGPKQKDTSLLVLWRNPGDQNYQVVNRYMYPVHQGTNWLWTGAAPGHRYEITAALQVDEKNTSTAPNSITVTAPAANVNFDLNTYYVMPRTDRQPVNEVCVDADATQATAILRLPQIQNGAQYWLQVGESAGQAGIYNQMLPADDQDLKARVRVKKGKQYFMRYSYATCVHCNSANDFAPFSDTVGFTCN